MLYTGKQNMFHTSPAMRGNTGLLDIHLSVHYGGACVLNEHP